MDPGPVEQVFAAALSSLIEEVKGDHSILAAVLCGSLSHDTVWAKSDVDLVFVTVDDRKVEAGDRALYADGVNIHAILVPRAEFRKMVEGAVRNSFLHAFLAKGRLLYTHDPTIADLCAALPGMGDRDTERQVLLAATHALLEVKPPGPLHEVPTVDGIAVPEVAAHARRPRLHRAVDPLRGHAAGARRGHRAPPAGRP